MTRLHKTKTDASGRNYYLCQCECGKQFDLRVDHINIKKCNHKQPKQPKQLMTKTIRYIPKGIKPNAVPVQEIKITAKSETEMKTLLAIHRKRYIILTK